jgi:hypothetical protein
MMAPPGGGAGGRPGFGGPSAPAATGSPDTSTSANDAMITLKIDSDKLPKAADLKSQIFPSTLSVSVNGEEIRLVTRGAFPDLSWPIGMVTGAAMTPAVQKLLEQAQSQLGTSAATPNTTATAPAGAAQPGTPNNTEPPRGGGRRRGGRPD